MLQDQRVERLLGDLVARARPNAKSLVVTILGDAIIPHGGRVGLGALIELAALCGISERAVRTSVFRLSKEGWVTSHQEGRNSYYTVTPSARLRFAAAERSIYASRQPPWDGLWTMVLIGLVEPDLRDRLRTDLAWQGFGQLMPGLMVHPRPDEDALSEALREAGIRGETPIMRGAAEPWPNGREAKALVARAWDLTALAELHRSFIDAFRPVLRAAEASAPGPEQSFRARTLLIHDYRRVLLREPGLPDELLPANWAGATARAVCRDLYRIVEAAAERHLATTLGIAEGVRAKADPGYLARFGGLRRRQNEPIA